MKGREKVCVEDGVKQCVARGCWQDWEFVSDISAAPYPDLTTPVKSPGNLVVHKLKRIRGGGLQNTTVCWKVAPYHVSVTTRPEKHYRLFKK